MQRFLLLLVSPIFSILQSCLSPVGKVINKEVSDSYYIKSNPDEVIYSPMGNWFELGKTKFKADQKTFKPLSRDIGMDKDSVYYKYTSQKEVDHKTFVIEDHVIKDVKRVYYEPNDYTNYLLIVEGADPSTFKYIEQENSAYSNWAKDKSHYYFRHKRVAVDYPTFWVVSSLLFADKNYLYTIETDSTNNSFMSFNLVKKDSVTGKIERLHDNYAVMGNALYLSHVNYGFRKFPFEKITSTRVMDEDCVVINNTLLVKGEIFPYKEVDVQTFQRFPDWGYEYTRDKNHIYFNGKIIANANVKTFNVLNYEYGKDDKHVFYQDQILQDANVGTFTINKENLRPTDGKTDYKDGKPFDYSKL